jgi:hypothetical protein
MTSQDSSICMEIEGGFLLCATVKKMCEVLFTFRQAALPRRDVWEDLSWNGSPLRRAGELSGRKEEALRCSTEH